MIWFGRNVSVLKTTKVNTAKTTNVITSCSTFNWIRLNGPPCSLYPILLAGTWNIYSNSAMPQLISIMDTSPSLLNHFHSENLRWPYQAMIIKELLMTNRPIVKNAFIEDVWVSEPFRDLDTWPDACSFQRVENTEKTNTGTAKTNTG